MKDNKIVSEQPVDSQPTTRGYIKFWITFVSLISLFIFLNSKFETFNLKENKLQLLYEIICILLISSWFAFSGKLKEQIKHGLSWTLLVLILATAYSYRFELEEIKNKIYFNLVPEYGHENNSESISFPISDDGHFYVRATINDIPVKFLVDTGASHIVISPQIAKKLGYDLKKIKFNRIYSTANGTVRGAAITLTNLNIGKLNLKKVPASINEAPLDTSLLGMSFFSLLSSYQVSKQELTLNWDKQFPE